MQTAPLSSDLQAPTTIIIPTITRASHSSAPHHQAHPADRACLAEHKTRARHQETSLAAAVVARQVEEARCLAAAPRHHSLRPPVSRSRSLALHLQARAEAAHRHYSVALGETRIRAAARRHHPRALRRLRAVCLAARATQRLEDSRAHQHPQVQRAEHLHSLVAVLRAAAATCSVARSRRAHRLVVVAAFLVGRLQAARQQHRAGAVSLVHRTQALNRISQAAALSSAVDLAMRSARTLLRPVLGFSVTWATRPVVLPHHKPTRLLHP